MQPIEQAGHTGHRRVRIVYDEEVVSLSLAADATLEDLARALLDLAPLHRGQPVSIDVTLPARRGPLQGSFRAGATESWLGASPD